MTRHLCLLAAIALALAAWVPLGCEPGAMRDPSHQEDLTIRMLEGDDFEQMAVIAGLEGQRLQEFNQAVAERTRTFEAFENGPEARQLQVARDALQAAKTSNDEARIAAARQRVEEAGKAYWDARSDLRADVMAHLTLEEQQDWGGYVLYKKVLPRFKMDELTDAQKRQLRAVANEEAARVIGPTTVRQDPYLKGIRDNKELHDKVEERAVKEVLTATQCDRRNVFL